VVLDPWDDYGLLRRQVEAWVDRGFVSVASVERVHWVQDPAQVLTTLEAALADRDGMTS